MNGEFVETIKHGYVSSMIGSHYYWI